MAQQLTMPPLVRGEWTPMSWDDFLDWCDEGTSEWVDGEGIAYVSNTDRHVDFVEFTFELIRFFVRAFDLGKVYSENFLLRLPTRPSGRMPDVMVVRTEHLDRIQERWVDGAADFVIEFISEDDPERDTVVKLREYEREGVPEYLWVDARPDHHDFRFHRRDSDGHYQLVEPDEQGRYHSKVLPGFWFDPAWFWQDSLPNPLALFRRISPDGWQRLIDDTETVK